VWSPAAFFLLGLERYDGERLSQSAEGLCRYAMRDLRVRAAVKAPGSNWFAVEEDRPQRVQPSPRGRARRGVRTDGTLHPCGPSTEPVPTGPNVSFVNHVEPRQKGPAAPLLARNPSCLVHHRVCRRRANITVVSSPRQPEPAPPLLICADRRGPRRSPGYRADFGELSAIRATPLREWREVEDSAVRYRGTSALFSTLLRRAMQSLGLHHSLISLR